MQSMHRGNYFYSCMCIHVEAPGRILIRIVSNPSEHFIFIRVQCFFSPLIETLVPWIVKFIE